MTDPANLLPRRDPLPHAHGDALGCEMRVKRVRGIRTDDDVVPCEPRRIEAPSSDEERVPQRFPGLADDMDSCALGHTVNHSHDLSLERRVDGLSPPVEVAGSSAEDQQPGRPGRMEMEPATAVGPHEVEREPLTEPIGPVARDSVGRGPLDGPLSPEGEIHHYSGIELTHLSASTWRTRSSPSAFEALHRQPLPERSPGKKSKHDSSCPGPRARPGRDRGAIGEVNDQGGLIPDHCDDGGAGRTCPSPPQPTAATETEARHRSLLFRYPSRRSFA